MRPYIRLRAQITAAYPSSILVPRNYLDKRDDYDAITAETGTVPSVTYDYTGRLDYGILKKPEFEVRDTTAALVLAVVPFETAPAANEVAVEFDKGLLKFHSTTATHAIECDYTPIGTVFFAEDFLILQAEIVALETGAASGFRLLATVTGINGKTTGATTLHTGVGSGVITMVRLTVTAASSITTGPQCGIGVASGENDMWLEDWTNLSATTGKLSQFTFIAQGNGRFAYTNGEVIKLGIDTAAVGTSLTFKAEVYGF